MFGAIASNLIELDLDRSDVAELPEADQFLDIFHRWPRARLRLPPRLGHWLCLILPFDLEQLPDRLHQLGNIDRLHQIAVVKRLRQRRSMRLQRARRYHQDAGLVVAARPQGFGHRPAVHARHRDIEQEQIGPAVLCQREAAGSVRRAQENEAERRQHFAQEVAMGRIVVGDQDRLARAVIAEDRRLDRRNPRRIGDFRQQDLDAERATSTDVACHPDVAAHHAGEQPADGQPEAGAGLRLRHAERTALEGSEDAFEIAGLDTGAGVDDLELRNRAAVMHDELYTAGLREFQGIRQQVDQNLTQAFFVGIDDDGQYRRPPENKVDAFGGGLDAKHPDELVEEFAQAHLVARQIDPAGLDLGNIEDPIDKPGEMVGATADHAHLIAWLRI